MHWKYCRNDPVPRLVIVCIHFVFIATIAYENILQWSSTFITFIHNNYNYYRRVKISQERLSSFKMELGWVRSGIPTQTFATPSHRYTFLNSDLVQCVRRIPSSLFGKCIKGYMQGIEVCLKQIKSSPGVTAKTSLLRKASILSKLCHQTVCFLHGVQCKKEPY